MKMTSVISIILALTILSGSVPYSYAYCTMMRKAVDHTMQVRCAARGEFGLPLRAGTQSLNAIKSNMRFLSKETTDSYERQHSAVANEALMLYTFLALPSNKTLSSNRLVFFEVEHPPHDIIVEILNLRI